MTVASIERWRDVVATVAPTAPAAAVRAAGERLLARWTEPHRAYHTIDHLSDVLARIAELGEDERPDDVTLAELAAWWHDAVYEPSAAGNEARSADIATATLAALGVDRGTVAEVGRLVRLTATHDADHADRAGALLCDADLAVLGSDPERYAAYAAAVRLEYAAVPDADFRPRRAAVLAALLARERLYLTEGAGKRFEAAARRNVAAEIAALTRPPTSQAPSAGGAARQPSAG